VKKGSSSLPSKNPFCRKEKEQKGKGSLSRGKNPKEEEGKKVHIKGKDPLFFFLSLAPQKEAIPFPYFRRNRRGKGKREWKLEQESQRVRGGSNK